MVCCATPDNSFEISGLDSLVPFTLVMILLRQSEHATPVGFGGGGAAGADGSGGPVPDLSCHSELLAQQPESPRQVLCFAWPLRGGNPWSGKENRLMETLLYIFLSHKGLPMQIKPKRHAGLHFRMNENTNS